MRTIEFNQYIQELLAEIDHLNHTGIYMVDLNVAHYIGKAGNLKGRGKQHLFNSHNKLVNYHIEDNFNKGMKISFNQISVKNDSETESDFIQRYSIHYNLLNKQYMYSDDVLLAKRSVVKSRINNIRNALDMLYEFNEEKYYQEKQDTYIRQVLRLDPRIDDIITKSIPLEELRQELEYREFEYGIPFGLPKDFWNTNVKKIVEPEPEIIMGIQYHMNEDSDKTFER